MNSASRLARAALAFGAAVALSLTAFGGGTPTAWTGTTSDDWFNAGNWNNGVPSTGFQTTINTQATSSTVINGASANSFNLVVGDDAQASLTINGGGSLTLQSSLTLTNQFFGNGTVTVTDTSSALTVNGEISVGKASSAVLNVTNGADLDVALTANLGVDFLGNGTVNVSGASSAATFSSDLYVGAGGTGILSVTGDAFVTASANVAVGNTHTGTLTLATAGSMNVLGNLGVANGFGSSGNVSVSGAGSVLQVVGNLQGGGSGHSDITVENGGSVIVHGNLSTAVDFGATSNLNVNAGGLMGIVGKLILTHTSSNTQSNVTLNGGELVLGGTDGIQVGSGNVVSFTINGGTLSVFGSHLTTGAAMTLAGVATMNTTSFGATLSGVLSGTGQLQKSSANVLTLSGNNSYTGGTLVSNGIVVITDQGTGSALGTGAVQVSSFGTLAGSGRVIGDVVVDGFLAPGASAGLMTFNGNVALTLPTSELQIEIGGLTRGTQYDAMDVSGNLSLNGVFDLNLINAFNPTAGDSFQILNVTGTIVGSFASYDLPVLGGGLVWDTSALHTTGVLTVAVPEPAEFACAAAMLAAALAVVRRRKMAA